MGYSIPQGSTSRWKNWVGEKREGRSSSMKTGDLLRNKQPGTTHITGLILEIFPNGTVRNKAQQTLTKMLWSDGHQTVEFMEDLKEYYEVIR